MATTVKTIIKFTLPNHGIGVLVQALARGVEWAEYNIDLGQTWDIEREWAKDVADYSNLERMLYPRSVFFSQMHRGEPSYFHLSVGQAYRLSDGVAAGIDQVDHLLRDADGSQSVVLYEEKRSYEAMSALVDAAIRAAESEQA